MSQNQGYEAVVDVDAEGDLGHTDLQEDLEFHSSTFETNPRSKIPSDSNANSNNPFANPSGTISSKRYLWSLSFYSQFFDVDTNEVLNRCAAALFPRRPFLDVLEGNPDLYGPFWIATTVVFILFLAGYISQYLGENGGPESPYDFRLLSGAAGLIYGYTFIIPVALWGVLRWFGSEAANLLECWALYGYANLIWIPVALISWSTLDLLNWIFVAAGFAISAFFLLRNLWPVVSAADQKISRIVPIVVILLHAGLAFTIKILFFAHGSPAASSSSSSPSTDPPPDDNKAAGDNDAESMIRKLFRA